MSLIDRAATFKGNIVDHGINETKSGYPQFVASLVATHIWDPDDGVWVDIAELEDDFGTEISAYMVLFGSKGETLNAKQVAVATGWDGLSYSGLDQMDLSEVVTQFRVEDHFYNGKESLQVNWIDAEDATPGSAIRKLESNELKALDAKFSAQLKRGKGKATKPVKAKAAKPKSPSKGGIAKAKGKAKAPAVPSASIPPVPEAPEAPAQADVWAKPDVVTGSTKADAWADVSSAKGADVTDDDLGKIWVKTVTNVINETGRKEEDFSGTDWGIVRDSVLSEITPFK